MRDKEKKFVVAGSDMVIEYDVTQLMNIDKEHESIFKGKEHLTKLKVIMKKDGLVELHFICIATKEDLEEIGITSPRFYK